MRAACGGDSLFEMIFCAVSLQCGSNTSTFLRKGNLVDNEFGLLRCWFAKGWSFEEVASRTGGMRRGNVGGEGSRMEEWRHGGWWVEERECLFGFAGEAGMMISDLLGKRE
jgi:hypothetical protein